MVVKLLNAAGAGATGSEYYIGVADPPYLFLVTATGGNAIFESSIAGDIVGGSITGTSYNTGLWGSITPSGASTSLDLVPGGTWVVVDFPLKFIRLRTDGAGNNVTVLMYINL